MKHRSSLQARVSALSHTIVKSKTQTLAAIMVIGIAALGLAAGFAVMRNPFPYGRAGYCAEIGGTPSIIKPGVRQPKFRRPCFTDKDCFPGICVGARATVPTYPFRTRPILTKPKP
jgi:hypothetical protein